MRGEPISLGSIETKTALGLGAATIVALIVGLLGYASVIQFRETSSQVARTREILHELESILLTVTEVESAHRGFLLADDETILRPYIGAVTDLPAQLNNLAQRVADNPDQQARAALLQDLVQRRLAALADLTTTLRTRGFEAARTLLREGEGRTLMEQLRATIAEMSAEENRLLDERSAMAEASGQRTVIILLLVGLSMLAFSAIVYNLIRKDSARRREAEQALESERNLLKTLMDNLPDSVFIKDAESRFVINNAAHQRILGVASASDVVGKTDFDFFPRELAERYFADEQEVLRTGQTLSGREEPAVGKDGRERWMLTTKVPLKDANGRVNGLVGISHDMTERRQNELLIQQLNHDLKRRAEDVEAANKELEAFSYSVSHDLRAPLRAMSGFSRILQDDYADSLPPEAARFLNMIQSNAEQMGRLIDDLLAFSRLSRQPLNKQQIAPGEVAKQVAAELAGQMEGREVELTIADLPSAQADPALLKQVYGNLIGNALKFTSKREAARIEVGWTTQDGDTVYFVRDNGTGFDMRYAHKLFGVFQRLHRAEDYEGTGVGLAIVQRVIHRHGGRVWAEAEPDKGATFYFTLEPSPTGTDDEAAANPAQAAATESAT